MEPIAETNPPDVLALFVHFLLLACVSVGGTDTVLPDIHRYLVEVNQWITNRQFADAYALARAVPGPNMLYVTLMGWQAAGLWGAFATTFALAVPPFTLTLLVMHLGSRYPGSRLGRAFRVGMAPITIGLMFASGWVLLRNSNHDVRGYALTAVTIVVVYRSRWNPLWLIAVGALAGVAGVV
jgi:chromate transporter